MSYPKALYRDILEIAEDGRGDGTAYAEGTGIETGGIDTDAKTFEASTGTGAYSVIDDLTDADDLFNGYVLRFDDSERVYHIEDYASPATGTGAIFTTRETPNAEDTGSFKVLRTLQTPDFDPDYPASKLCDGRLYSKWKAQGANESLNLLACLPNGVDDGGFELNSLSDCWTTSVTGDGTISVNSSSPILGTHDLLFNMGTTATYLILTQAGKIELKKGKTYGIVFKAYHSGTGTEENELTVALHYVSPADTYITGIEWGEINSEDYSTLPGDATPNWKPDIESAAEWEEIRFTVSEDIDAGDWVLYFRWQETDSQYDLYLDEICIFEVIEPSVLIIAGHNMAGGFPAGSSVTGYRCPNDRTSWSSVTERVYLLDLDATVTPQGKAPIYEDLTETTKIFPMFSVVLSALAGKTWEAGEIFLGELWTWANKSNPPLHGKGRKIEANRTRSKGGVKVSDKIYQQKTFAGSINLMDSDEADIWTDFAEEVGHGKPFWLVIPAVTAFGIAETPVFVSCVRPPSIEWGSPINYYVSYEFEEAF